MNRERALKGLLVLVGLLFVATVYPLTMFLWSEAALAMMLSLYVGNPVSPRGPYRIGTPGYTWPRHSRPSPLSHTTPLLVGNPVLLRGPYRTSTLGCPWR